MGSKLTDAPGIRTRAEVRFWSRDALEGLTDQFAACPEALYQLRNFIHVSNNRRNSCNTRKVRTTACISLGSAVSRSVGRTTWAPVQYRGRHSSPEPYNHLSSRQCEDSIFS